MSAPRGGVRRGCCLTRNRHGQRGGGKKQRRPWDITLNDPKNHSNAHHGTKVNGKYIKGKKILLNYPSLEREEQLKVIDLMIVHFKIIR